MKHEDNKKPLFAVAFFVLALAVLGGFFALGYVIATRISGELEGLALSVVSSLIGFVFFGFFLWILSAIRARVFKAHFHDHIHDDILFALDQMARGNFSVLLAPSEHDPHADLVEAINKMAHDLGGLETMRQDFISNVSHEIQSPLTSIGGFAAILKKDDLPDADRRHYAEIIEAETRRLSSLSDNLLKLSTLGGEQRPLVLKAFSLDKQLRRITLAAEPQWSAKHITVEADLPPCEFTGDEDLLSQVWTNLLYNAIKFTPENGRIVVSLAAGEGAAVVTVSDTGSGIAPEDQLHIFERFYKADKARDRSLGGNGLGLALVKRIAELHGGSATVESVVQQGASFKVTLPQPPASPQR